MPLFLFSLPSQNAVTLPSPQTGLTNGPRPGDVNFLAAPPALKRSANGLRRRVQRHSPDSLLRRKLVLPGDVIMSAEKHKGRLVVRVEMPDVER